MLLVPNVVAVVVIHPRFHYFVLPAALVLAVAAVVVSGTRVSSTTAWTTIGCATLTVLVVVAAVVTATEPPRMRPTFAIVDGLRRLHDHDGVDRVVNLGGDLTGYVKGLRSVPPPWDQGVDLVPWLEARDVDAVVAPANALAWARSGAPEPTASFLLHPERSGWTVRRMPGDVRVYRPASGGPSG